MSIIEADNQLQITLKELSDATDGFSDHNLIARSGFGTVYKGISIKRGCIAIKVLDPYQGQGDREFKTEIALLSVYKHENIVSFIGFCDEEGKKILVYKYESNGSLDKHLNNPDLKWIQRLRICLDAARGLQYLHNDVGSEHRILHRDIKSANILLDGKWNAKISDFGLSKIGPANMQSTFLISYACGTPGYIDPDYLYTGFLTQKSDVYSFGVVLFEVLCGRRTHVIEYKGGKREFLTTLVKIHWGKKTLDEIIYSDLHKQMNRASFVTFSSIAYQCLMGPNERPTMKKVVEQLQKALEHQLVPSDSLLVYGDFVAYHQGQARNTETACRRVSLIRDEDSADPIEVRLIRKWQSFAFKDECFYLFVDKEGYAIEGCGHNRDKAYFEAKMILQGCYRISDYLSQKRHQSHNVVPGHATIKIAKGTSFMPIDPTGFPSHYFNFLPFEGLPNKIQTNYLLTDYIGCFVSITMDETTSTGRRLLKFLLEDPDGNYIEVALWQEIADRVDIPTLTSTPFPCIVAVTSMKVKKYHRITLESNSPTHVYINPEVTDTDKLVDRFKTKYANIPEHLRGRRHVMRFKTRYANVPKQQRRRFTVAELLQINPAQNSERRFSCMATVKNFVQGKQWFYRGCIHCKRKLLRRSPGWACSYHPNEQQQHIMYCVNAVIEDKSGTTTVTLFDGAVYSLAQINAMTVVAKGFADPNILPDPLHVIIGKRAVFQLQYNNRVQGSTRFISNKLLQNPIVAEKTPENNTKGLELQPPVQQVTKPINTIATETNEKHTDVTHTPTGRATDIRAPPLTTPAALPSPNRQLDADASVPKVTDVAALTNVQYTSSGEGTNMTTASTKRQLQFDNSEANKDKRSRTKD